MLPPGARVVSGDNNPRFTVAVSWLLLLNVRVWPRKLVGLNAASYEKLLLMPSFPA